MCYKKVAYRHLFYTIRGFTPNFLRDFTPHPERTVSAAILRSKFYFNQNPTHGLSQYKINK